MATIMYAKIVLLLPTGGVRGTQCQRYTVSEVQILEEAFVSWKRVHVLGLPVPT